MKVCLLTEGSYPYVVGGVSAWTQMLIEGLQDIEFSVYSIGAFAKDRGAFKYKFPQNFAGIQEVFFDEILAQQASGLQERMLSTEERQALLALVSGEGDIDFARLIEIFHRRKWKSPLDIFMARDFFDIIRSVYREKFSYLPFTDFFWTMRSMLLPLFYLLQQEIPEADIYHSVATGYCGIIGGIAATLYHKPYIITEHGIYSREREAEIIKSEWAKGDFKSVWISYFYALARLSYSQADHVYTLFEHNAEIEAELGCDPGKIGIVPNGIHMERFKDIPELEDHSGPIRIGAVVRVVPIKDIVTLLRAFLHVQQAMPDTELYVMGNLEEDPEYADMVQRMAAELGLERVYFTGSIKVTDYLPRMDILVLSSISEGQTLSVLEGFAAHRPYVTTDVGCCRELIYGDSHDTLGTAGAVVPPLDDQSMAEEILRLARDYPLRKKMAAIGYERVKRGYTHEHFIDSYRRIYQETEREGQVRDHGRRRSGAEPFCRAYRVCFRLLADSRERVRDGAYALYRGLPLDLILPRRYGILVRHVCHRRRSWQHFCWPFPLRTAAAYAGKRAELGLFPRDAHYLGAEHLSHSRQAVSPAHRRVCGRFAVIGCDGLVPARIGHVASAPRCDACRDAGHGIAFNAVLHPYRELLRHAARRTALRFFAVF